MDHIDAAIERLYETDTGFRSRDFLVTISDSGRVNRVASANAQGALLVDSLSEEVGIFIDPSLLSVLTDFSRWKPGEWTLKQRQAFAVTAEEISHFHYYVFQGRRGRNLSQVELEIQGEIDKFLLSFFANATSASKSFDLFKKVFEQTFFDFSLVKGLSREQRERYLQANQIARRKIKSWAPLFSEGPNLPAFFREARKFYRLDLAHKLTG